MCVAVTTELFVLTSHTVDTHRFCIVEYPLPYSFVKYIPSKLLGTTIVLTPFNTQLDVIFLSENKPPKVKIASQPNVIS